MGKVHGDNNRSSDVSEMRSFNMSRIQAKNTKPELVVRRILHAKGLRFRLHAPELPGRPDIVFRPRRKAIFVHGCFWHRHEGCRFATNPKTREDFWQKKFASNIERDKKALAELNELGWSSLVVWECEIRDVDTLTQKLMLFLSRAQP